MTGKQLQIYLPPAAAGRLSEMARQECRRPIDQARYLLLRALLGDNAPANNSGNIEITDPTESHAGAVPTP